MMLIATQWAQVAVGVGFALLAISTQCSWHMVFFPFATSILKSRLRQSTHTHPTHYILVSMAPIPQSIYTRFIDQSATPNLRPVDATRPLYLACILRILITTALPNGIPTSNCTAWCRCFLALPSYRDHAGPKSNNTLRFTP
jgi:hypothetical protein